MPSRRFWPTLVVIALLSGCAAGAATSTKGASEIPPPTAEALAVQFPFDSYLLNDSETQLTYQATDHLIRPCMRKAGYKWAEIETPSVDDRWRNRLHYGVVEPLVAERFGYHSPADLLASPGVRDVLDAMKERDAQLSSTARESEQGCRKEAGARLTRNAKVSFTKLNNLKSQTYEAAQHDPAVRTAFRQWSACMKKRGHSYGTPVDAGNDRHWFAKDSSTASGEEKKTAIDDVRCKEKNGLLALWFGTEKRLEQEAIRKNSTYLSQVKRANEQYLVNSRQALKGS
ncbi:hypothetical protein OG285_16100 [Streptomyces sp. NBC_01471]|uniref:hypothetical protein n=1 Tax=Streptomyces sp. NBC_01471 TaxID=2903879 RepID=UPI0032509220